MSVYDDQYGFGNVPDNFNWRAYLHYNPDVKNAGFNNPYLAAQHFNQFGWLEGRNYTLPGFDPEQYLEANSDLRNAFGENTDLATEHYIDYVLSGKEQRSLAPGAAPTSTTPAPAATPQAPAATTPAAPAAAGTPSATTPSVVVPGTTLPLTTKPVTVKPVTSIPAIPDPPGLTYDAVEKRWRKGDEKTDYKTDEPEKSLIPTNQASAFWNGYATPIALGYKPTTADYKLFEYYANEDAVNTQRNAVNADYNTRVRNANDTNRALNIANAKKNQAYEQVLAIANNTTSGTYTAQRDLIRRLETDGTIDKATREQIENSYKLFYRTEKLTPWDPTTRIKPPSPGGLKELDTTYYKTQVPQATAEWEQAVKDDNIDITERYNNDEKDFYRAHYTTQGKANGIRGYAPEETKEANVYLEKPTDLEKQQIKDSALGQGPSFNALISKILGPKELEDTKKYGALAQSVLKDTITQLNKAKSQEKMLDVYRGLEGFSEIMDLNKTLANSIIGDSGVGGFLARSQNKTEADITTDLETQLGKITGLQNNTTYNWQKWFNDTLTQKYGIDYKQYQSTEDTLDVVNAALQSDPTKIYSTANKKFTDEFTKKAGFNTSEQLIEFLKAQGTTGTNLLSRLQVGNVSLDEDLKSLKTGLETQVKDLDKQKNRDLTLTYKDNTGVPEEVKIEASFARQFVDEYLKPRFDYSKSMDEFVDYMNVTDDTKNVFQSSDRITEVKNYAQSVAQAIQGDLDTKFDVNFNTDFYFNPDDKYATQKQNLYSDQKTNVAKDWETAKANPDALIDPNLPYLGTWAENAYLYNVKDFTDKDVFAKLHYQILGIRKGYDAAMDPASTLQMKLESPVATKAQSIGSVFGSFVEPEEFADSLLKGIDPLLNRDSWTKLLKQYDLDDSASIDEVKKAITDSITTGSAETIRANIKTLQELEKTPTQAELGISYIERPEDKTTTEKTELYNIFKKAGYTGTEQSFYADYMPDTSPEDVKLLTDVTKGKMPKLDLAFDAKDPIAALSKIQSLTEPPAKEIPVKTDSYFKIGLDDEEDSSSTTTPDSFLSDFTSLLKK